MPESKRNTQVYIAGPMHGYPEHNFPAFERAELLLRNLGVYPVSPRVIDPMHSGDCMTQGLPYKIGAGGHFETCHLAADLSKLVKCDAIYMLDGWQASVGARLELSTAVHCGLRVYFQNCYNYQLEDHTP